MLRILASLRGFRVPNTRNAALVLALGVAALGFGLGMFVLFVAPTLVDSGLPGFAPRAVRQIDVRSRLPGQPLPTPNLDRPELWLTPIARRAFPSERHVERLGRATSATFRPGQTPILPMPVIRDAIGRSLVAPIVTFTGHFNFATPEPSLPVPGEVTQVSVAVLRAGAGQVDSCILAAGARELHVFAATGAASQAGCEDGILDLEDGTAVGFALLYDELPNYQTRSGIWYEGSTLGQVEVRVAPIDPSDRDP